MVSDALTFTQMFVLGAYLGQPTVRCWPIAAESMRWTRSFLLTSRSMIMSVSSESRTATRVISITARNVTHRMVLILCATAMALFTMQAFAHHGWAWAEEEQSELKGTITEISMVPPHPTLRVKDQDGRLWQVDLGNPNQ